jgi:hypothetical protein
MLFRTLIAAVGLVPALAHAGLDVTAFERLTLVPSPKLGKNGEPIAEDQVRLAPVDHVERFAGLKAGAVYRYGQVFGFRAGSYSGYNEWRNELAKLAGYQQTPFKSFDGKTELRYDATVWKIKKGPFWELIDFSDAEGVIGPAACKRVHQDFLQYQAAAAGHPDKYFRSSYEEWMKAFAMCANDGAIVFH